MSAVSISTSPPQPHAEPRVVTPGSVGWCASDLDDLEIEGQWFEGHHEMIEGVITAMAPAYFSGGSALFNLMAYVHSDFKRLGIPGRFGTEIDVILNESTVVVADAVFLTPQDERRQQSAFLATRRPDPERTRVLVPPSLIIESVSPGHERHDQKTKRRLYAEFKVPRYWILNAFTKTLECLEWSEGQYETRASDTGDQILTVNFLTDLRIPLAPLWAD